jgi:hypothetical protein
MFDRLRYHFTLNGYSLIPSWWRDRPYETQQPANKVNGSKDLFIGKGAKPAQGIDLER